MTNEEIKTNLAQAKALRDNVAPASNSPVTMDLRAKVADAVETALLQPSATSLEVTYYPLEKYSAVATLPTSEIVEMIGDDLLTYVTLKNAELRLRLQDNKTTKYLVMFLRLK